MVLAFVAGCGDEAVLPPHPNVAAIVDGRVELIDTATHERDVVPEVADAEYVAWSHDGSRLATLSTQQELRVFDLPTESFVTTLRGVDRRQPLWSPDDARLLVRGAIVSPDGKPIDLPGTAIHLSWSSGGRIVQFPDIDTAQCLSCSVDGVCAEKTCSALSPEGDVFAVPRNRAIDYVRARDDQVLETIDCASQTTEPRSDFPWSSRSVHVVGCPSDDTLRFFDPSTTATTSISTADAALAWSPDGEYLVTATRVIRMTDHASTPLPTSIVYASWSPNSEYWIGASIHPIDDDLVDSTVAIFRPTGAQIPAGSPLPSAVQTEPPPTTFSPSNRYFALTQYTNAFICDSTSFTCTDAGPGTVSWLDDDRYLMLRSDSSLVLVDRVTGGADALATSATAIAVRPL